ncbi:C-C motif chemokine 24-like [Puntigrus tetrazona]|uniref:C-C motif chemokine 24-like n=1 Tax=Puntigrus tetrazona TaxID=1606681 RepID=UPI001C8AA194|nr:C-C motif chemokine 24-like [Puntigrus tetrazona]
MRPFCIFITCLVIFTFCSLTQVCQSLENCCLSYRKKQIPLQQIVRYHITSPECDKCGIIIITKAQRKVCADPTEEWVKRLMKLPDLLALRRCNKHERPVSPSNVGANAKNALQSFTTTETILQPPEETTLVLFKESQDWKGSLRTTETTPLEEMCLVRLKDSHDWSTHFCIQPGRE